MKNDITTALLNLHESTGEEWFSLKDIYSEVEKIRKVPNANEGASIRACLEYHSKASDVFKGDELYISKGKGTGMYKSAGADRFDFIKNINTGDTFTLKELMSIFRISGQSGIMKTNLLNALVLTTSEESIYGDSGIINGTIQYTGEGLVGDQTITKNNKTIYHSKENNLPMYLFSKDKNKRYIFEGRVELYDIPYQVEEKDSNGNNRLVYKFPLKVIYKDDSDIYDNEKFNELVYEVKEIEEKFSSYDESNELEYREGPLNIRKYRKTDRKIQRTNKPDYIAEEIIKSAQGVKNEKLVYEYELKRLMEEGATEQIKLMEEFFNNKKENEGYDVLSFELDEKGEYIEKYIEVKSTKSSESTPIDITSDEIDFAKKHIDNYYLYRIINSDTNKRYLKIVKGKDLLNEDKYKFISTTYKIYSN